MDIEAYRQMAEIQEKHWWFEGRRAVLRSVIENLKLQQAAEIMEAGCGSGANLAMLDAFGSVKAFEPDAFVREKAQSLVPYEIKQGFLPHDIPFKQEFDLICAFDVIEHVKEDADSLKALCNVTKKGGYAVFTVPAYPFMWSKHDDVNHHFRRYTAQSFKAALKDSGYVIEKISYYNCWLFPVAFCVRMAKKFLKLGDSGDLKMPGNDAVNSILAAVFASERHILKYTNLPFGLSLLVVCRKP